MIGKGIKAMGFMGVRGNVQILHVFYGDSWECVYKLWGLWELM